MNPTPDLSRSGFMAVAESLKRLDVFAGHELAHLPLTGSTNDDLKNNWQKSGFPQQILVADNQTAGRGQFERKWLAEPEQSLLFSFSIRTSADAFALSMQAGSAVINALRSTVAAPEKLWLKWPNDIWAGERKLAGILVDSCLINDTLHAVIGIGINLTPLKEATINSVSLAELGSNVSRQEILYRILQSWDRFSRLNNDEQRHLWTILAGRFWATAFSFSGEGGIETRGIAREVLSDGTLRLRDSCGNMHDIVSASIVPVF